MDGYNSHITFNFIAFCMKYLIKLLILFLHILHFLQLFNVGVFAPLKYVSIEETNTVFKFNFNYILRAH